MKPDGIRIGVVPDPQIDPTTPNDHMRWAAEYFCDKEPEGVVIGGDVWTMPSLSSYNSKFEGEGLRIWDDVKAGHDALDLFMGTIGTYQELQRKNKLNVWRPWIIMVLGNHEARLNKYLKDHPELIGTIGMDVFARDDIEAFDFLDIVEIEGVLFSHFFQNQKNSRPIGGMMETRIKNIGHSFVAFHEQGRKFGSFDTAIGRKDGLVVGSYYCHDEEYRGSQANNEWRGLVMMNEVKNGTFDPCFVSIQWLCGRYEGMLWSDYRKSKGLI